LVTERLAYEYKGHAFADEEWPLRVAVVGVADAPRYVLFMVSHLAVDRWGMELACDAFDRLLSGTDTPPDAESWHPREQAAVDHTPAGARMGARAAEYWRRTLLTAPQTVFPAPQPAQPSRWCPTAILESEALAMAARALSIRYGASPASVVLTAAAALLSLRTGNPRLVLRLFAANRYGPRLRGMVGTCVQLGLVSVDLDGGTFAELIDRTWAATVLAYRHSRYPPDAIEETIREVNHDRGIDLDLWYHFHDATDAASRSGADGGGPADIEDITAALAGSRFQTSVVWGCHQRFLVEIEGRPGVRFRLAVTADPAHLPRAEVERLTRGIETVVVAAAAGEVPVARLPALTAVTPAAPSATALWYDRCLVEPDAVRDLLADIPGVVAAEIAIDRDGAAATAIVGHVATDRDDLTPDGLHRACLALLPGRRDAVAPSSYVIHDLVTGYPPPPRWAEITPVRCRGTGRRG
jgi:hypothetical protein